MASFLETEEDAWNMPALAAAAQRRNKASLLQGALSGAQTGASAGSAGGPWGAAIGGVAGLLGGAAGAALDNGEQDSQRHKIAELLQGRGEYAGLVQNAGSLASRFIPSKSGK